MDSQVEEIKARLSIVELIGGYVHLVKAGAHWKACCPFHNEKTPSFTVNEERQMWHCFGCNKGGDAFAFLMEIEGLEFREALQLLAERTGVELKPYRSQSTTGGSFIPGEGEYQTGDDERAPSAGVSKARVFGVLELATKFGEKQLWSPVGAKSLAYLQGRGLTDETIKQFRIGYIPKGWRHLADFLASKNFTDSEMLAAGLLIEKEGGTGGYDRFRERIMFPILDVLGRVIGFSARVEPGADESQAKYINTPETVVYHKSSVLYGIAFAKQAMKSEDQAIFVEGQMDVIAMHQAGFTQTVAVSGTALTEEQLKIIKRYTTSIRLFFDMDKAGQTAARRSTELALKAGLRVMIVAIEGGKDAAELAQHDPDALRGAIQGAIPALDYFLQRLMVRYNRHNPEGRRDIVEDFATLLSVMPDVVERSFWLKRLAETVESDEHIVAESVDRAIRARRVPTPNAGAYTPSVATPTASSHTPFTHRSEILRQRIGWCCLLDASLRVLLSQNISESVQAYLSEDPILGNANTLEAQLREAMFASEQFLEQEGLTQSTPEERHVILEPLVRQYLSELTKELQHEALKRIEYQMKQARESGNREEESRLRAEFARVLSEK
ncbi:MAG: DNA primase [Candidatus Moraniibacteriota bacterium]